MSIPIFAIVLITVALLFEFSNGLHDTANAVATSIATKSLTPVQAITISAVFNLIGALSGTAVAITIVKGFADPMLATPIVIFCALISAISWNVLTAYFGIPSSSSHALIAGLVGAILFKAGLAAINFSTVLHKVILPMLISPMLGFCIALLILIIIYNLLRVNSKPYKVNNFMREIQVLSTAFLSFSHGTNDAQKTMGIITLVLFNYHLIQSVSVPKWVVFACALCMALGTFYGGIKIIKTLSTKVSKLRPASGIAVELSSALILFAGSRLGIPLSTTHAVSGSVMGAGSLRGNNWSVVKNMVVAWVLTIPVCIFLSGIFLKICMLFNFL
ncbi:MAG: inorganic phosphate transporter [Burkholderiales bacterium]|jgi:PiT family inorganic phosphate transporter|nr:inorganic phosphate transporter [Burkholderiales bacterium]